MRRLFFLMLLFTQVPVNAGATPPPIRRSVRVLVIVDEATEIRIHAVGQNLSTEITNFLDQLSFQFLDYGIRFVSAGKAPLVLENFAGDGTRNTSSPKMIPDDLQFKLQDGLEIADGTDVVADLVLGISGETPTGYRHGMDVEVMADTVPFSRVMFLRWLPDVAFATRIFTNSAVHELRHLFGVPHSKDPLSPMYPTLTKANIAAKADDDTRRILNANWNYNFRKGVAVLPYEVAALVYEIFRKNWMPEEHNPLALAYTFEGKKALRKEERSQTDIGIATNRLQIAAALDPSYFVPNALLTGLFKGQGNWERVRYYARRAIDTKPGEPQPYIDLAVANVRSDPRDCPGAKTLLARVSAKFKRTAGYQNTSQVVAQACD